MVRFVWCDLICLSLRVLSRLVPPVLLFVCVSFCLWCWDFEEGELCLRRTHQETPWWRLEGDSDGQIVGRTRMWERKTARIIQRRCVNYTPLLYYVIGLPRTLACAKMLEMSENMDRGCLRKSANTGTVRATSYRHSQVVSLAGRGTSVQSYRRCLSPNRREISRGPRRTTLA